MKLLITGATGSLGTALVRHCLRDPEVKRIVAFSRDEVKQAHLGEHFGYPEKLRLFLGDVRDQSRLEEAMWGCDVVVHCAALKKVDALAYNPSEVFQTNILGTWNVLRAARGRVERVLVISSDKACVVFGSSVMMMDGPQIPIGILVGHQLKVPIQTFDGREIRAGTITEWHQNPLAGRPLFHLSYSGAKQYGGRLTGVTLTGDHEVLTTRGWVAAQNLDCSQDWLVSAEPIPNDRQKALITGTLLGDSSIIADPSRGPRAYFRMGHAGSQRQWLEMKVQALHGFTGRNIASSTHRNRRYVFFVWNAPLSDYWQDVRSVWYAPKKRVAREWVQEALTNAPAVMLAAWYQDDGCLSNQKRGPRHSPLARLATHGFSFEDVAWLVQELSCRGFTCHPYEIKFKGLSYWEIRFDGIGTRTLFECIGSGVVPALRHKVADPWASPFDSRFWDLGTAHRRLVRPIVRRVSWKTTTVYCLNIADHENFIVSNIILHNCRPQNSYGISKAAAEHLAVNENVYGWPRGTRTSVLRYGNVLGSRGSVLQVWRDAIIRKQVLHLTHADMTRFWLTLDDAVGLVHSVLDIMQGGEIFVPVVPSMQLRDLALALDPSAPIVFTGLRPGGEKLHEELLTEEELSRTLGRPDANLYVVTPAIRTWSATPYEGLPVQQGWTYRSDQNNWWLTVEQMRTLLEGIP